MSPVLELRGIVKRFGARTVLAGVDLALEAGEIHALLGENGAGKTTLVRIALGLLEPDGGELRVDGRAVRLHDPKGAAALGFGMVHQHFTLADGLTVAENLLLAEAPAAWTRRALHERARARLREHGLEMDPGRRVSELSVGEKQRLEIAKALARAARVLVLDEPTAVLAPREADALFAQLEGLRAGGRAILLITHKLDEALAAAQRVTVLRGGRVALSKRRAETSAGELTRALFGEEQASPAPVPRSEPAGDVALRASALIGGGFGPVDLELRAGEAVAIAGVDGNGQTELLETLAGLRTARSGRLELLIPVRGVAFVSGDRQSTGLALDLAVAENVAVKPGFLKGATFTSRELVESTAGALARFDVQAASPWQPARRLSGGNQQKVVLARELANAPRLVLAENPTRGLDLRAAAFVRGELAAAAHAGAAVLIATTELEEALALADRLFVAHRGRLHPCERSRDAVATLLARLAAGPAR